jgi:hypothetical protein
MQHRIRIAAVAGVLALGLGLAPVAQARDWHDRGWHGGERHHHGDATGAAIAAGIIGLGLGAAIASGGGYAPPPAYYGPPPAYYGPPPPYYAPPPPAVYYGY